MSRFSKCTFPAVSPPEILAQLSSRALYIYICVCVYVCGPGSSVSIATDYGMDGPGSNPGGDEMFCPSRLGLGPNKSSVKWVTSLSRR